MGFTQTSSIRSKSSNRSKRFERLKRLERFELRLSAPGLHLAFGIFDLTAKSGFKEDLWRDRRALYAQTVCTCLKCGQQF
jgi:hypothetical protein